MNTATTKGLVAEHIACAAVLEMENWRCVLTPMDKVDAVAWNEINGLFVRIQIKSSGLRKRKDRHWNHGYQFSVSGGKNKERLPCVDDFDVICFVANDVRRCAFYATEQMRQRSKRFSQAYFQNPHLEEETWETALEIVRQRK